MKTYKIEVKQEHITEGGHLAHSCPIKLAITEQLELWNVKVFSQYLLLDSRKMITHPERVENFIDHFDHPRWWSKLPLVGPIRPFSFDLHVPD